MRPRRSRASFWALMAAPTHARQAAIRGRCAGVHKETVFEVRARAS